MRIVNVFMSSRRVSQDTIQDKPPLVAMYQSKYLIDHSSRLLVMNQAVFVNTRRRNSLHHAWVIRNKA